MIKIPKGFRGFAGDPRSEIEVVFLFGLLYDYLQKYMKMQFVVTEINDAFPDCECVDLKTGNIVHIEFELKSSHYIGHRHPKEGCDYIVCWEDDWPDSHIPVISLRKLIQSMELQGKRFLHIPAHGSVYERHELNKERNPQAHAVLDYFLRESAAGLLKQFPELRLKEGTKHFNIKYRQKPFPLLEVDPSGTLFCKKASEIVKLYGEPTRKAAEELKAVKESIGVLRKQDDSDRIIKALEKLIKAVVGSL